MTLSSKAVGLARRVDRRLTPVAVNRPRFHCPICGYEGRFHPDWSLMGRRVNAQCPGCECSERHRSQALVMDLLAEQYDFSTMSMLHISPEHFLADRFRAEFGTYVTADLGGKRVDLDLDLTDCDLPSASFDVIYASHVFEHIEDDLTAARTVRRLLRPGGFAVLPVPIVVEATVEFPERVDTEYGHVRAPGPDYFDRFSDLFEIECFTSPELDQSAQVWVYENRTHYPTRFAPYRTATPGRRHVDIVPVLRVPTD